LAKPKNAPLDFSMFSDADVLNLCLQRGTRAGQFMPPKTRRLTDHDGKVKEVIAEKRDEIFEIVFEEITEVFETFDKTMAQFKPSRVADIGSGYAFVDLLIYRKFKCDLLLIDIEETDSIHFGYKDNGAGYSDLNTTREFLVANGVPDKKITTVNPKFQDLSEAGDVDVALSLISCGFHYPASTYEAFFKDQVKKAIMLDLRRGRTGLEELLPFGTLELVAKGSHHNLVLCKKHA